MLSNKKIKNLPLIVESNITKLKTKELIQALKKILEKELFELALKKKSVREGRGKMRSRMENEIYVRFFRKVLMSS